MDVYGFATMTMRDSDGDTGSLPDVDLVVKAVQLPNGMSLAGMDEFDAESTVKEDDAALADSGSKRHYVFYRDKLTHVARALADIQQRLGPPSKLSADRLTRVKQAAATVGAFEATVDTVTIGDDIAAVFVNDHQQYYVDIGRVQRMTTKKLGRVVDFKGQLSFSNRTDDMNAVQLTLMYYKPLPDQRMADPRPVFKRVGLDTATVPFSAVSAHALMKPLGEVDQDLYTYADDTTHNNVLAALQQAQGYGPVISEQADGDSDAELGDGDGAAAASRPAAGAGDAPQPPPPVTAVAQPVRTRSGRQSRPKVYHGE